MSNFAKAKKQVLDYLKFTTIAVLVMTVICAIIGSSAYLLGSKATVFLTILFWLLAIVVVTFSPILDGIWDACASLIKRGFKAPGKWLTRKDSQEN